MRHILNSKTMKATKEALNEFNKVLAQTDNPQAGIRVFSEAGCCGPGLQHLVAEEMPPGDKLVSIGEVNFFVEEKAEEMLKGVTVDFWEKGFRLDRVKRPGGCC